MAYVLVCDGGCGFTSEDKKEFVQLGVGVKREYCKECGAKAQEFIKERDELHDWVAKQWKVKLAKLAKRHQKELPKGKLPDGC